MFKKTVLYAIIISSSISNILALLWGKESNTFEDIFRACNDFTNPLYMNLSANTDKNIVISPLNLHIILYILSNGAEGSTLNEMRSVLGYNNNEDYTNDNNNESLIDEYKALIVLLNDIKNVSLHIGNAIYIQEGNNITLDFHIMCLITLRTWITKIDFKNNVHATEKINKWVRIMTHNKIFNIISPDDISINTKIVLLNAIYFKSTWRRAFNKKNTQPCIFHVSKTESYLVPTMFKEGIHFYGEILDWHTKFIEIPYLNEDIVMVILLPDKEIELQDLENNFNWQTLVNERKIVNYIDLYLPKFKFEITINLKDVLHKIGLNTMFDDNANFTRLSKLPLKVSNVLQRIYIEINEQGSEVAAVTVANMRLKRRAISPVKFVVDRPFMFAIEHKPTKLPLFLGSVRELKSFSVRDEL